MPVEVEFYWIDFEGIKHLNYIDKKSSRLIKDTYVSRPWVFKNRLDGRLLFASFYNESGQVFEGHEFNIKLNLTNHVIIGDQGIANNVSKLLLF